MRVCRLAPSAPLPGGRALACVESSRSSEGGREVMQRQTGGEMRQGSARSRLRGAGGELGPHFAFLKPGAWRRRQ